MDKSKFIGRQRERRRHRVRKNIIGTGDRPRLTVSRSHQHIGGQLVDDAAGKTLVAVSTRDKDLRESISYGGNKTAAQTVGKLLAERALAAGIKAACFDRGHNKYHGRVAALADAARAAGLTL